MVYTMINFYIVPSQIKQLHMGIMLVTGSVN